MLRAQLQIEDRSGRRIRTVVSPLTTLGRRGQCTVQLQGSDVSREHADITDEGDRFVLRDRASKFGTFVNGERVAEHVLAHGDRITLGQNSDCRLVFVIEGAGSAPSARPGSAAGDLRLVATLLDGLRALGSERVLDDVLAMVLDSAIELTHAERGFIMLAGADNRLEFKMGRGFGRTPLSGSTFDTSRKIPEEVFANGVSRMEEDVRELADTHGGTAALGIRLVLCVPLVLVRFVEQAEADHAQKRIGVLYLDSRERGALTSTATRHALETLAAEAAAAIENAWLYRQAGEKARLEQDLRIAAEIQQALMPPAEHDGACFRVAGASVACRAIGGDFFDYRDLGQDRLGIALGDVAGKGAAAALLAGVVQGMFTVEASDPAGPAGTLAQINRGLRGRNIESKFVTMFFGVLSPDGCLTFANGGHNPPVLIRRDGVVRLEAGGVPLGMFDSAAYTQETVTLEPGDTLVVFSDGISEAQNPAGEEYGDGRLIACLEANRGAAPAAMREALLASARAFAAGAHQSDDMTVLIVSYGGA
jgi:phosphoserine phosphatase RsbU/P